MITKKVRFVVFLSTLLATYVFIALVAGLQQTAHAQEGTIPDTQPGPVAIIIAEPGPNPDPLYIPGPKPMGSNTPFASTINIGYINGAGCSWGDEGTPGTAAYAFRYAADQWQTLITSTVPISISATWSDLGAGVLGSAAANNVRRNFSGALIGNVWFVDALADKLHGSDLGPGNPDINASFNCTFSNWYFGTDNNPGAGEYDFVEVVMHELGHGLGFVGAASYSGGSGSVLLGSYPVVYTCFTGTSAASDNRYLLNTTTYPNNSTQLGTALTGGDIFFYGADAQAANGGNPVELYAPGTWASGSSYSHLGESFNGGVNTMMTYSAPAQESVHNPGPVVIGMFNDMGWDGSLGDTGNVGEACNNPTAVTLQSAGIADPATMSAIEISIAIALLFMTSVFVLNKRQRQQS